MAKVLVVDDSPPFLGALAFSLRIRGYDVLCASDGEAALRVIQEDPSIGLVLLDLALPGVGGADVIAAIRSQPATRHLPVVVLTAVNDPVQHRRLRPHVQEWVAKGGLSLPELLERVRHHLPPETHTREDDGTDTRA